MHALRKSSRCVSGFPQVPSQTLLALESILGSESTNHRQNHACYYSAQVLASHDNEGSDHSEASKKVGGGQSRVVSSSGRLKRWDDDDCGSERELDAFSEEKFHSNRVGELGMSGKEGSGGVDAMLLADSELWDSDRRARKPRWIGQDFERFEASLIAQVREGGDKERVDTRVFGTPPQRKWKRGKFMGVFEKPRRRNELDQEIEESIQMEEKNIFEPLGPLAQKRMDLLADTGFQVELGERVSEDRWKPRNPDTLEPILRKEEESDQSDQSDESDDEKEEIIVGSTAFDHLNKVDSLAILAETALRKEEYHERVEEHIKDEEDRGIERRGSIRKRPQNAKFPWLGRYEGPLVGFNDDKSPKLVINHKFGLKRGRVQSLLYKHGHKDYVDLDVAKQLIGKLPKRREMLTNYRRIIKFLKAGGFEDIQEMHPVLTYLDRKDEVLANNMDKMQLNIRWLRDECMVPTENLKDVILRNPRVLILEMESELRSTADKIKDLLKIREDKFHLLVEKEPRVLLPESWYKLLKMWTWLRHLLGITTKERLREVSVKEPVIFTDPYLESGIMHWNLQYMVKLGHFKVVDIEGLNFYPPLDPKAKKRVGLSFVKCPSLLLLDIKKIKRTVDYLLEEAKIGRRTLGTLCKNRPNLLTFNLETRIKPRVRVIQEILGRIVMNELVEFYHICHVPLRKILMRIDFMRQHRKDVRPYTLYNLCSKPDFRFCQNVARITDETWLQFKEEWKCPKEWLEIVFKGDNWEDRSVYGAIINTKVAAKYDDDARLFERFCPFERLEHPEDIKLD